MVVCCRVKYFVYSGLWWLVVYCIVSWFRFKGELGKCWWIRDSLVFWVFWFLCCWVFGFVLYWDGEFFIFFCSVELCVLESVDWMSFWRVWLVCVLVCFWVLEGLGDVELLVWYWICVCLVLWFFFGLVYFRWEVCLVGCGDVVMWVCGLVWWSVCGWRVWWRWCWVWFVFWGWLVGGWMCCVWFWLFFFCLSVVKERSVWVFRLFKWYVELCLVCVYRCLEVLVVGVFWVIWVLC